MFRIHSKLLNQLDAVDSLNKIKNKQYDIIIIFKQGIIDQLEKIGRVQHFNMHSSHYIILENVFVTSQQIALYNSLLYMESTIKNLQTNYNKF